MTGDAMRFGTKALSARRGVVLRAAALAATCLWPGLTGGTATAQAPDLVGSLRALHSAVSATKAPRSVIGQINAIGAEIRGADDRAVNLAAEMIQAIAAEQAAEGATGATLLDCQGRREDALARLDALDKAFQPFERAQNVLKETREAIQKDELGLILGPWWHGGVIGSVYYVGRGATDAVWFETPAKKMAEGLNMPYTKAGPEEIRGGAGGNGILTYPDGAARARFMLVPGGDPATVMAELQREGMDNIAKAFRSGMGYAGICSGAFLVTQRSFKLWPGSMSRKAPVINGPPHDIVMPRFHPLARTKSGEVLRKVPFTGGANQMTLDLSGTEYVGFFLNGGYEGMEGNPAVITYTPPGFAGGRLVACPAHPEIDYPPFVLGMCEYAIRTRYALPAKKLSAGEATKGVIGDQQNQYYWLRLAMGTTKLVVALEGLDGNCQMSVLFGGPHERLGGYRSNLRTQGRSHKQTVSAPKPGVYFVVLNGLHTNPAGANYTLTTTVE